VKHVSGKAMCKALEAKGWTLTRINGSHHVYDRPGAPRLAERVDCIETGVITDPARQGTLSREWRRLPRSLESAPAIPVLHGHQQDDGRGPARIVRDARLDEDQQSDV
jgi:HicA toxin of bacterial toxin-antitoxin,